MEELSQILKSLDLNTENNVVYEFNRDFKNMNNLPIDQIYLEKTVVKLRKEANLEALLTCGDNFIEDTCFETKKLLIPALDKTWVPENQTYFTYLPYNFTIESQENDQFISKNLLFLKTLEYLLCCNYHQFWCLVLFEPEVRLSLHSFILNPILPHQVQDLDTEQLPVYITVLTQFLYVYQRLLTFHESDNEYMDDLTGVRLLLDNKLLNLPILITLINLYEEIDLKFVNNLIFLYFYGVSQFRDKEIEEMLRQVLMTFEMIGGHVCGFEPDAVIVPIAIDDRPKVFNLSWVYSVVNYLLNTVTSLHVLLKYHTPSIESALAIKIPYRMSFIYESVFFSLYEMLIDRQEALDDPRLIKIIYEEIALASGESSEQQHWIEVYLTLMTTALEDEYFICDYNERYNVSSQNEMFSNCAEVDETRTGYIADCIKCLKRHNRIWKTLNSDKKTLSKALRKYQVAKSEESQSLLKNDVQTSSVTVNQETKPSDEEIELLIQAVRDIFPHLGDGFVLRCLEFYNYQENNLISAILEENLPPHLIDIPFDEIRIPPEPEPEKPILFYQGKKPGYDDALKLLDDKKDIKEIKTFILDGIQYTNEYDMYDDEYDDRLDEETVAVPDFGPDANLKFNPNHQEEAVSDTSYSEDEYDEKGTPLDANKSKAGSSRDDRTSNRNFCEDPAEIRARREAKYRSQGKRVDVVGKPKGQGQEKNVQKNREKKNVNKSSRANHNRKSGSQWKRSRGMLPS